MVLRIIYTLFIGVLLATFVGVGIAAFYEGPKAPEPPASVKIYTPEVCPQGATLSAQQIKERDEFDIQMRGFIKTEQNYSRDVSIISLTAAILILVISLTLLREIMLIADGLLLGGVLTLIYSIIRGFASGDNMFRFIVVSVGLAISLILGYIKFIRKPVQIGKKK